MKILLSINAGSSSIKISAFVVELRQTPDRLAEVRVAGLTAPPATLSYSRRDIVVRKSEGLPGKKDGSQRYSQLDAFELALSTLFNDGDLPEIRSKSDIAVVCHRIVHGGDYDSSQLINSDETFHHLESLGDLAPLHNGPALSIVRSCIDLLPRKTANVACFDTEFHSTIPRHIYTYPIDQKTAVKNGLRKYGFHGISYSFITRSVAAFLGKDTSSLNIIALHLGSGASACAVKAGASWDTSMGLTPLAGLPGATRSGSIDPSLVFHYASDVGKLSPASTSDLHISRAEHILNEQCGWKSLTGTTDFGVIAASDEPSHRLAFDLFVDRICGFVGSYYVALGGHVDALVFAGGIGEKSAKLRKRVTEGVSCLGFEVDDVLNSKKIDSVVQEVSRAAAGRRTLVCCTDEQSEMARLCSEDDIIWQNVASYCNGR